MPPGRELSSCGIIIGCGGAGKTCVEGPQGPQLLLATTGGSGYAQGSQLLLTITVGSG